MTAKRKPKELAPVLTETDGAVLAGLPQDERAMVEDVMRQLALLTAAEALAALRHSRWID